MDIGKIGVLVGLISSVLAIVLYALSLRGNGRLLVAARVLYGVAAVSAFACFGRLMWLVVHKEFQYDYVREFVSADLRPPFLYAATWAGQQGSFLLWAIWTAAIGALVAWKAGKWEARVMPFYITVLAFLFGILAFLSPYASGRPAEWPAGAAWPPTDGTGLNPALQNWWMALHPPTIFFGFASLAVPFAYAIAAMLWKEYSSWAQRVMPWALLTSVTLGVGLFMGGYWAYETQGWHGFWGWDPVENASLFPWLGALALVHGLIVQKSRGGMGRTNLLLSVASWLLFIYGTYLTRSGILADFSVHAFGMSDNFALKLLLVMVGVYGLLGLALLAWRWRGIPGRPISDRLLSRDTAMVTAVTLMMVAAVVVAVGTSWPLISRLTLTKVLAHGLYSAKGQRVEGVFYNKVGSALLIPGLVVLGVVPFLAWGKTNSEKLLWKLLLPWFSAIALGFGILFFVWHQAASGFKPDTPPMLVVAVGTLGLFATIANIGLAVRVMRSKTVTMGGWLAHVGIGLLFAGTVLTNVYERTESVTLVQGQPPMRTSFGYALQFAGWTHDDELARAQKAESKEAMARAEEAIALDWLQFSHAAKIRMVPIVGGPGVAQADDSNPHAGLDIANPHAGMRGGGTLDERHGFTVQAPVFRNLQAMRSGDPEASQFMRWPYIHSEPFRDVYVLVANDPRQEVASATLRPGENASIGIMGLTGMTGYSVEYKGFSTNGHMGQAGSSMGAQMVLHVPDGRAIPIHPTVHLGGETGVEADAVKIPGIAGGIAMISGGIDPQTKELTVQFLLPDVPPVWVLPVSVTNKPMIGLVWLGVLLMGVGTLFALTRRSMEARKGVLLQSAVALGAQDTDPSAPAQTGATNGGGVAQDDASADPDRRRRRRRERVQSG